MHRTPTAAGRLFILILLVAGCAKSASTSTAATSASGDNPQIQPSRLVENISIVGVGLALATSANTYPEVQNVIVPSPANTAGILKGDKVLAVDGESAFDKSLEEVVGRLRGTAQSQVELTLDHAGKPRTIRLIRQALAPKPE